MENNKSSLEQTGLTHRTLGAQPSNYKLTLVGLILTIVNIMIETIIC